MTVATAPTTRTVDRIEELLGEEGPQRHEAIARGLQVALAGSVKLPVVVPPVSVAEQFTMLTPSGNGVPRHAGTAHTMTSAMVIRLNQRMLSNTTLPSGSLTYSDGPSPSAP